MVIALAGSDIEPDYFTAGWAGLSTFATHLPAQTWNPPRIMKKRMAGNNFKNAHFLIAYEIKAEAQARSRAEILTWVSEMGGFWHMPETSDLYAYPKACIIPFNHGGYFMFYGSHPPSKIFDYEKFGSKIAPFFSESRFKDGINHLLFYEGEYVSCQTVAERLCGHYVLTGKLLDYDEDREIIGDITYEKYLSWMEQFLAKPEVILSINTG
jgi:hypothetical protein